MHRQKAVKQLTGRVEKILRVNTGGASRAAKTVALATANTAGSKTNAQPAERAGVSMEGEERSARTVGQVSVKIWLHELMSTPCISLHSGYCVHNRQKNRCYDCKPPKRKADMPVERKPKKKRKVVAKGAIRQRAMDKIAAFVAADQELHAAQAAELLLLPLTNEESLPSPTCCKLMREPLVDFQEVFEEEEIIVVD